MKMLSDLVTKEPSTWLHIGDSGPVVKLAQESLARVGYALRGTGYFGNATLTAVMSHQRASGVAVDGVIGDATAHSIDARVAVVTSTPAPPRPQRAEDDSSLPLWFQHGLSLLNTREAPGAGNNLDILEWAREEGGSIAGSYTADSIAWCALFANHCLTHAGLQGTETLWALDFANPAKWPATRLSGPAVGAFAPMERRSRGKLIGGHITMVAGRDQAGNIMGLGGNKGDEVSVRPFPPGRILSYWWPLRVSPPTAVGVASLPLIRSDGRYVTEA